MKQSLMSMTCDGMLLERKTPKSVSILQLPYQNLQFFKKNGKAMLGFLLSYPLGLCSSISMHAAQCCFPLMCHNKCFQKGQEFPVRGSRSLIKSPLALHHVWITYSAARNALEVSANMQPLVKERTMTSIPWFFSFAGGKAQVMCLYHPPRAPPGQRTKVSAVALRSQGYLPVIVGSLPVFINIKYCFRGH